MSSKKNYLITGGAGFLGCNLVSSLLEKGNLVTVLDNLYTGFDRNLASFLDHKNFTFIKHDIIEPLPIMVTNSDKPIDVIVNLACPASPPAYQKDPIFTLKTNIMGTTNLLELAVDQKATFLQASTSEVYGDPAIHPQTEEYWGNVNPVGMRSCYDEGKRLSEALCYEYNRAHDITVNIVRIFNTYGPMMDPADGRVVSNFIMQALRGEDLTIHGDGSQTRSLCFVTDLIRGMETVIDSGEFGPTNLGNPHEVTMLELAEYIIKLTGSKSNLIYHDLPQDDPTRRCPDITRAKKLGWQPIITLEDGLSKTIEYYRTLHKNSHC